MKETLEQGSSDQTAALSKQIEALEADLIKTKKSMETDKASSENTISQLQQELAGAKSKEEALTKGSSDTQAKLESLTKQIQKLTADAQATQKAREAEQLTSSKTVSELQQLLKILKL